jgi:hypothetical protein
VVGSYDKLTDVAGLSRHFDNPPSDLCSVLCLEEGNGTLADLRKQGRLEIFEVGCP